MKITNASSIKLNTGSGLPNMSQTIIGWFQPITFGVVTRSVADYETTETVQQIQTRGVVQPYRPEPLEIELAGTRSWNWRMVHCLPELVLETNQYIWYEGTKYKVIQVLKYDEYGYRQYNICETYDE